jgi:3-hydroxybutyryl-CoA dehydrogenase
LSETVAIIGAGPLGRWLALSAARAGFRVLLEDVMPANLHHAQEYIRGQLGPDSVRASQAAEKPDSGLYKCQGTTSVAPQMQQNEDGAKEVAEKLGNSCGIGGKSTSGAKAHVHSRTFAAVGVKTPTYQSCPDTKLSFSAACLAPAVTMPVTFVSTIEDAVRDADLAIDCVPDELESKLEILWLLDRMAPPRTVFATPTTRLSIADLAGCTYREGKCVAIAAEAQELAGNSGAEMLLRTTARTTPETIALVEKFWRRLGFTPSFQQEAVVTDR